jgi:hypothetical protein
MVVHVVIGHNKQKTPADIGKGFSAVQLIITERAGFEPACPG